MARAIKDLAQSFRTLCRNPGFLAVATLTLALGLGPTTAVFSLFEALMLRTLPVERPGELALLGPGSIGVFSRSDLPQAEVFSYSQYTALAEDSNGVLAAVAAAPTFQSRVYWGRDAGPGDVSSRASCFLVTGSYFPLLGVRPFRGRLLEPDDDGAPGASPVAVVSHAFWATRLGGDPGTVGSSISIQGIPFTIVGIAEPSFRGHTVDIPVDLWVPMAMQEQVTLSPSRLVRTVPAETYWLNILARLEPGVSLPEAETAVNARLQEIFLDHAGDGISHGRREELARIQVPLTLAGRGLSRWRKSAGRPLALLWGTTGVVLLIACANLGSLLIVRSSGRRDDFRVRLAMGASRMDLMRPVLAESVVLSGIGTITGLALAFWLLPLLRRWLLEVRNAGALDPQIAAPELLFAAGAGVLTVFATGLFPAMLIARSSIRSGLRMLHAGITSGFEQIRARSMLVSGQVALSVVLLVAAGLFLRTLGELRAVELGVDADTVVGIRVDPRGGGFRPEAQPSMRRRILERVAAIPGVESAAFTGSLPLAGNFGASTISISGYTPADGENMAVIHVWTSQDYFRTLGIRLLEGRLPASDERGTVVVNRAFADRFFPARPALGAIVNDANRIIGIVDNVRQVNVRDDPPPVLYRPATTYEGFLQTLAVRLSASTSRAVDSLRDAIEAAAPGIPVDPEYQSVRTHLERGIAIERMLARLVGAFAAIAVLLSAVGLFGVCSQMVRNRVRELGLRMALGATRWAIAGLVIRRAAALLAFGAAVGALVATAVGRISAGLLYEVDPFDWTVLAWTLATLTACMLPATALPAVRAGRVSPAGALRED